MYINDVYLQVIIIVSRVDLDGKEEHMPTHKVKTYRRSHENTHDKEIVVPTHTSKNPKHKK